MAKANARRRRTHREDNENSIDLQTPELSLEEILEEFRAREAEQAAAEESASEPVTLQSEDDSVLTGSVETAGSEPEPVPEEPAPEERPPEEALPEEQPQSRPESVSEPILPQLPEDTEDTDLFSNPSAADRPTELPPSAAAPALSELLEGFEDEDDFYAGYSEERDKPAEAESPEETPAEEEDIDGEEPSAEPEKKKRSPRESIARRSPGGNPVGAAWGRLVALLAAVSVKRERDRGAPPPEIEDQEVEMEPRKAANHYAAQLPSLKMRSVVASVLCLLLAWITLSAGFGWPLPGGLETNTRAASLVCLAGELTVMLLGLDILTSGVMSLLRGRPGAESLIILSGLAAVLDTVAVVAAQNTERGIAFCVLPAAAMTFALWGAWLTGKGYFDSFMTFFHVDQPTCVSSEDLPEMDAKGLVTSRAKARGFIRRSEEPGPAESLASAAFIPLAAGALAVSLAAALGSHDLGAFFHIFALMTALCASFGWLFAYPVLFSKAARHLMLEGAALAGWLGAKEIGKSRHLVLRDTDIFPEDAMEITGIRILDRADTEKIISYTGSLLSTAGTGSAAVFTELMRIHKATFRTVEDFAVGEGGCRGTIEGSEVRIGTAGFMHLSAVKIPDKLKAESALYTAVDGELTGVFLFRYRPLASVQRALFALRKARRKPIFAVRDFNLDPMALRREFGVSTEGFRFPTFPERYSLSAAGKDHDTPAAGLLGGEDLETMVDLCEWGGSLYRIGRICAWACLGSAILGIALMIAPCWTGNWAAASAARALLYMLAWTLPGIAGAVMLGK